MRFEDRAVLGREMPEYLGNTAVLTRFGQLKRAIDCRCHESRRYHEVRAETNVRFRAIPAIEWASYGNWPSSIRNGR